MLFREARGSRSSLDEVVKEEWPDRKRFTSTRHPETSPRHLKHRKGVYRHHPDIEVHNLTVRQQPLGLKWMVLM